MWDLFVKKNNKYKNCNYSAWSYGVLADELADLTLKGVKTATASAYDLYEVDGDSLPEVGECNIILNGSGEAICITETTNVEVIPFHAVTKAHAFKEGEGDRTLSYWRREHEKLFKQWLEEVGLTFNHESRVVCETFEVVYS